MKLFSYIIVTVVAISIIAGFFILGTPQAERMRRLDETRVMHLQDIQYQVINYWQNKDLLPENLDLLVNETQGVRPPVDPETNMAYEYRIVPEKQLTFELCATFKTESREDTSKAIHFEPRAPYAPYPNWNWQHGIGRACFERAIDPDLYPKVLKESIR